MIVHISPFNTVTGLIDEKNRLKNVTECNIERDATDETSLLESCSVSLDTTSFSAGWYAIDALSDGVRNRLGVFYLALDEVSQESNGSMTYTLAGKSVLYPAYSEKVVAGWSVVKGDSGIDAITKLLSSCPVDIDIEPFAIAKTQTYSSNVTKLGACWSILRSAGMCIQLGGGDDINDCSIRVIPTPTYPSKTISLKSGELTGQVSVSDDEVGYSCRINGRPYDRVYVELPTFGIQTNLSIASQSIDLSSGLICDETLKEKPYVSKQ